jgi:hypothetical protein
MEMTPEQFTDAVVQATEAAKSHRLRVVLYSATAAFIAGAAIALPTTLVLTSNTSTASRANAQRNCETQALARPQGNARAFVQKITLELAEDAFRLLPSRFRLDEIERINTMLAHEKFAPGQLPHAISGIDGLARIIHPIPLLNCAEEVRG